MSVTAVLAVSANIVPNHWIYLAFPLVVYATISFVLSLVGDHGEETNPVRIFFRRISDALEKGTGYPGWAMAGVLSGLVMLGMAAVGLYWDVAWHIDLGRDRELLTPSHAMIVLGLGGLIWAAGIAVVFATNDRADVGFRFAGLRIPWSALSLGSLGLGGLIAFPFDALWHEAYGIDVTLWSPSHLMLLGGGGLATISVWLMFAEARTQATPTWLGKGIQILVAGAVLVGLSTFQGEFDFGVPQFQLLYWPLLVVMTAGLVLVTTRIALGVGGALATAAVFVLLRTAFGLLVAGSLNHTVPRFPLYLVAALAVEAVAFALGTKRVLRFALASGAAISTVGLAAEVIFADASGWFSPNAALLGKVALLAPVAGMAAAVVGAGLARAYSGIAVPGAVLAAAGVVMATVVAFPFPRTVGAVDAVIRLRPQGDRAFVQIDLTPTDAAVGAAGFGVVSWQGGGTVKAEFEELSEGRYLSNRALPITGDWKTMIGLMRGDQVMAAPVYLPADPLYAAPEIPALAERRTSFVRNTDLFLRETKPGPAWPGIVSYLGVLGTATGWVALFALVIRKGCPTGDSSPRSPALGTKPRGSSESPDNWYLASSGGSRFSPTDDPGRR